MSYIYFLHRYHLLQVKIKQIIYPKYEVEDADFSILFETRDSFVNYAESVELATEFFNISENNEHEKGNEYFHKCYAKIKKTEPIKVCNLFRRDQFILLFYEQMVKQI